MYTQNIAKSKIKCKYCNIIQEKIYKCLTCKQYICTKCNENHSKEHKVIEYIKNNFNCINHNHKFVSYCNKCQQDLCSLCEVEHRNENDIINYTNKIPNNINETEEQVFKYKINEFTNCISGIIERLNKLLNKLKAYYDIYYYYAYNYDITNINNLILNNINEIANYNEIIKVEINKVINENLIDNKISNILLLYNMLFKNKDNIIKYEIKEGEDKVKIFGKKFIENNNDKCKIICNEKEYDLIEYFDVTNIKNGNNILEIELKINKALKDMSYMFDN